MGGTIKSTVIIPGTNLAPIDVSEVSSSIENTTNNRVPFQVVHRPKFKADPIPVKPKDKK